jgi:hypothetical protein
MTQLSEEELAKQVLKVVVGVYGIGAGQPFSVQSLMIQFDSRRADLYRGLQYAGGRGWITENFTLTETGCAAASGQRHRSPTPANQPPRAIPTESE